MHRRVILVFVARMCSQSALADPSLARLPSRRLWRPSPRAAATTSRWRALATSCCCSTRRVRGGERAWRNDWLRCADWVECDTVGFSPLHSFSFRPLKLLAAPLPAAPPRAGLRVVQRLSWQQRLSALASQPGQLAAALLAAVRIYRAASTGGSSGQARQQPAGGAAWPADGGGAPPPEVQRQLLTS